MPMLWKSRLLVGLFCVMALAMGSGKAAEEGEVMTLDDLGELSPHLQPTRPAPPGPMPAPNLPPVAAAPAETAVEVGDYYYYDDAGNLIHFLDGRHYVVDAGHYDGLYRVPAGERLFVEPGPGLIVGLSPHDSWPPTDDGDRGYYDRGYTITGDPTYMSYYERNYGWGRGVTNYAGPRFDRPHITAPMPSHRYGPGVTTFQERFPGRRAARPNSSDPLVRREARREFHRDLNPMNTRPTPRPLGTPRARPPR
ncbi:MAG: hypothetical protein LUE17_09290 [Planctomycetaceae bacterium]|nr:hypothetical protein [Planctomycetaceae bacterium]